MVTDTAKRKAQDFVPDSQKMNRVRPATNALFVAMFVVLAAMAIIPVIFVFIVSISSETSIREVGYSFFPIELSNTAYMFLWNERGTILNALGISVLVTGVGTVLGLFLTTTMGYVLSRPVFKLKGFYTWVVFIPMIFNGGMLASYVINTNLLRLSDTVWSLILPRLATAVGVFYLRQYILEVPDDILDAARIDGCRDFGLFWKIVCPVIKPALASWASLTLIARWNDFFWPLLFLNKTPKFTLMVSVSMLPLSDGLATPWQVILAGTTLVIVPSVLLYLAMQTFQKAGALEGAIKG